MKRINSSSARKIKWILAKRASQAVNEANTSAPRLYHWPSKNASRWNPCRCLTLTASESKDGKNHMLPFCILRGDITFHNIYH